MKILYIYRTQSKIRRTFGGQKGYFFIIEKYIFLQFFYFFYKKRLTLKAFLHKNNVHKYIFSFFKKNNNLP